MVNHRVELQSPKLFGASGTAPVLLERSDRLFMQNVQAELGDPHRHAAVRATVVTERKGGGLHLYQPVHRVFHLAVIGAVCFDGPHKPRLDPLRIESAGLVIRKVRDGQGRDLGELAWVTDADGRSRWEAPDRWDPQNKESIAEGGSGLAFADPDPKRRPQRSTGLRALDERIAVLKQRGSSRAEAVSPLFPLAPKACTASGETLLVGLVPTASRQSEEAPQFEFPATDELESGGFFPDRIRAASSGSSVPFARETLDVAAVNSPAKRGNDAFMDYVDFVREMLVAFDARGTSLAATRLSNALKQIQIPFKTSPSADTTFKSLYQHLVEAAPVVVEGNRQASFRMPHQWGTVSAAQETEIKQAIVGVAKARFSTLALDRGRFADKNAEYIVRTYVRVRRPDGCGPDVWWSSPSPSFKIAPWYDSSPGPRPVIELPDPFRDGLDKIKPNVSFAIPPSLSSLLGNNKPEDLLEGKGNEPSGIGLMWICSFSIPIITICAFIMLSILISLLNLFFWWLPFVKICIPIPKPK